MALIGLLFCTSVFAQTYQLSPNGDGTYTVEPTNPLPSFTVNSFDEGIQALRNSEGVPPTETRQIMQDPANPIPAVLCTTPTDIRPCIDTGLTVQ